MDKQTSVSHPPSQQTQHSNDEMRKEVEGMLQGQDRSQTWQLVKMLMIIALPVCALVGLAASSLVLASADYNDAQAAKSTVDNIFQLANVVTKLQLERGYSTTELGDDYPTFSPALQQAKRSVDEAVSQVSSWPSIAVNDFITAKVVILDEPNLFTSYLGTYREMFLTLGQANVTTNLQFYNNIIMALIRSMTSNVQMPSVGNSWSLFVSFIYCIYAQNVAGIQRALGAFFYTSCVFKQDIVDWFSRIQAETASFTAGCVNYNPNLKSVYSSQLKFTSNLAPFREVITSGVNPFCNYSSQQMMSGDNGQLAADSWFNNMTVFMSYYTSMYNSSGNDLKLSLSAIASNKNNTFVAYMVIICVITVACIFIGCWYSRNVYHMTAKISSYAKKMTQKSDELDEEKKKTERLLFQMLPASVAMRLKQNLPVEAEYFDAATMYFSDIVGFTKLSARSTAEQVVVLLNTLYSLFDEIISKHDAYKVETIGDAYLVVSGVPTRNGSQHAAVIARLTIEIITGLKTFEIPHMPLESLRMRIGIHTGPCMAGVVGTKMPRYCLFGETVIIASRMESSGEPMKIQLSEATKNILTDIGGFALSERGVITIPVIGNIRTYWLLTEND